MPWACCEVLAYLQWAKVARSQTDRIPLFINMDETVLKLNYSKLKGLIVTKKSLPPGFKHKKEQVSSSEEKAALTYCAFITHDSMIQPQLPQVILGNKQKMTLGLLAALAPHKPANFHLWREDSSWNCKKIMCRLLTLLSKSLAAYKDSHQIILVLDVAKCHYHRDIFAHATKLGIRLVFVPAKLTWLLQPCDTSFFGRLKRRLRKKWLQLRVASTTGKVSHEEWMTAVLQVAGGLLCSISWMPAFQSVGLLGEGLISQSRLQQIGWKKPPQVSDELPTADQLKVVFPKRSKTPTVGWNSLFSWRKAMPMPVAKAKAKAKAKASASSSLAAHAHAAPMLV